MLPPYLIMTLSSCRVLPMYILDLGLRVALNVNGQQEFMLYMLIHFSKRVYSSSSRAELATNAVFRSVAHASLCLPLRGDDRGLCVYNFTSSSLQHLNYAANHPYVLPFCSFQLSRYAAGFLGPSAVSYCPRTFLIVFPTNGVSLKSASNSLSGTAKVRTLAQSIL